MGFDIGKSEHAGAKKGQGGWGPKALAKAGVLRTLTGVCVALTLAACSSSDGKTIVSLGVAWKDYAPGLQAKIDAFAIAKNCDGMQAEFNQIGATNLAERNKFGHGNEEVLKYIDGKEREANCFPSTSDTLGS